MVLHQKHSLFPKLPLQPRKTAVNTGECIQRFEPCCATGDDGGTGHACVETGGKHDSHSGKVSWAQHLVPGVLGISAGGMNRPQSPQIQTGSPADYRWKKHLSHMCIKLLPKSILCLSRKGQWAWWGDLSHPDREHHAGPFPFRRKTRQGRGGGHC